MVFCMDNFFLLSVYASLVEKKKIRGGTGNTWGCNFYTGTQNGSEYEI